MSRLFRKLIAAYHERLNNPKYSEAERTEAALGWSGWEDVTSFLNTDLEADTKFKDPRFAIAFATIENEYFHRSLQGNDPVLRDLMKPENIARLRDLPTHVVQGGYDQVCVPLSARKFRDAMHAANVETFTYHETVAGHALSEKPTFRAVTALLDGLPLIKKNWQAVEQQRPATNGISK